MNRNLWIAAGAIAAVVILLSMIGVLRQRARVARVSRKHDDFGQRFKRSGFVELGRWNEAHTHPVPLDTR